MVKARKRKNSASMRRASRVYLTQANVGKVAALRAFLLLYVNVVNYFIERFWSMQDFTPALADYKTSQRCHSCGKIDSRNRKGERFRCVSCGHEDDADHNAAKNLEYLGLAGVYSLRLLPN